MANLSAARSTKKKLSSLDMHVHEQVCATSTTIYQGGMVAKNASGLMVRAPATKAGPGNVAGVACETIISAAAGKTVKFEQGIFLFANSGSAALAASDAGKLCYVEDDQTVCSTNTATIAGVVYEVTTEGVWVAIDYLHQP